MRIRSRIELSLVVSFVLIAVGCADSEFAGEAKDTGHHTFADAADAYSMDTSAGNDDATDALFPDGDVGPRCQTAEDCPTRGNATPTCKPPGYCVWECNDGFVDLDGEKKLNGCECETSEGGMEVCDNADNDCDGMIDEETDKMSDDDNCGMCGNKCEFPNGMGGCNMGSCELTGCMTGFKDCDGMASNGCEVDVTSNDMHCGMCNNACSSIKNGSGSCKMGSCTVDSCDTGYGDCNDMASDGCETDTTQNTDHCGMCGKKCGTQHTQDAGCRAGNCYINGCSMGWDDCDGDLSNGCEQNIKDSTSHCGQCNNVCVVAHAKTACKSGKCSFEKCDQGYHDLDGDKSNGCEYKCTVQSMTDVPDAMGNDENCDGIDGMLNQSVFVATPQNGGNNSNSGRALNKPVATVTKAIGIAKNCSPKCDVLVSAGTYDESVSLESGVDVYGGYAANNWQRNVSGYKTVIRGQNSRAVIANNLTTKTEIDGIEIHGKDYSGNGQSTYGLWVKNTSNGNLKVDYARIEAGDGGDGRNGADGSDGADGSNGSRASGRSGGSGGNSACNADGGRGGSAWDCGNQSGQRGSAGGDSSGGGWGGSDGSNKCGGCNDSAGNGGSGSRGGNGSNGGGGNAPGNQWGSFNASTFWTGATGTSGSGGQNGRGGGGGGAGGTDDDDSIFCPGGTDVGGGGGGGGAGGCGGRPGQPGQPGGGSFAVVLANSLIEIENTTVVLGTGGDGGNGGRGGDGGSRGNGRTGTNRSNEAGDGGGGADGGVGGAGGGGGGACGGPAVGIAQVGSSNFLKKNLTFNSGSGGSGGSGGLGGYQGGNSGNPRAASGSSGCTGGKANTRSFP